MSDAWVTLRTFDTPALAELAKLHLAEAGIDCQLLNTEIIGMNPLMGNACGYIPLQVCEDDLDAAEKLLSKMAPPDAGSCPNCGEALNHPGPCLVCGFVSDDENPDEVAASPEAATALDGFRRWRKPIVLLFLAPMLVSLVLGIISAVGLAMSLLWW